jgi:hypothetical protein
LFPQGRERFELGSSGRSRVLGVNAVGGPPQGDFTYEGDARVASRGCPDRPGVTLAGVIVDLGGEVGDQLESLGQVVTPDGMLMQGQWNAWEPRQRATITRHERCEAPIEDGGHVACGSKVASGSGCQHVAQRVFTGFGRDVQQMGSQGRPGGFIGESGDVLVGLIKLCDCLWSRSCSAASWRLSV